jgi:hypothetical protein
MRLGVSVEIDEGESMCKKMLLKKPSGRLYPLAALHNLAFLPQHLEAWPH